MRNSVFILALIFPALSLANPLDVSKSIPLSQVQSDKSYVEVIRVRSDGPSRVRIVSDGSPELSVKGVSGLTGEVIVAEAKLEYGFLVIDIPQTDSIDNWVVNFPQAFVESVRRIEVHTNGDIRVTGNFGKPKKSGRATEMEFRTKTGNVKIEYATFPGKFVGSTIAADGKCQISNANFVEGHMLAINGQVEAFDTNGKLVLTSGGGTRETKSAMIVSGLHKEVQADVMSGVGHFYSLVTLGDFTVHTTTNSRTKIDGAIVAGTLNVNLRGTVLGTTIPLDTVLVSIGGQKITAAQLVGTGGLRINVRTCQSNMTTQGSPATNR